jgi:hypothetical protein
MMLNGVSVARLKLENPPSSTTTFRSRFCPACAPSAGPFLARETGTQISHQNRACSMTTTNVSHSRTALELFDRAIECW